MRISTSPAIIGMAFIWLTGTSIADICTASGPLTERCPTTVTSSMIVAERSGKLQSVSEMSVSVWESDVRKPT